MSESSGGTNATQNQQSQNQQSTLTDAQLRAVLDEYSLARSSDVQTISQKLDTVSAGVASVGQKADGISAALSSDAAPVVVIDGGQWSEMQDAWLWCKSGMQVGLFLVLLLSLCCAAMLGSRLWSAFSKGWRK